MTVLWNALWQIFFSAGLVLLTGMIVSLLNDAFVRLAGRALGYRAVYVASLLGTPVHELSHALACMLFGHKITDMRLLTFDPMGERLGYVRHTCRKDSLYQRIGNFFIAVAPIYGGCAVMLAGLLMLPGGLGGLDELIPTKRIYDLPGFFAASADGVRALLSALFSAEMLASPWWWLYALTACSVALHINVEPGDLRGGAAGFVAYAFLVVLFHAGAALIDSGFYALCNSYFLKFQTFITVTLCLAVLFSAISAALAGVVFAIRKTVGIRRKAV